MEKKIEKHNVQHNNWPSLQGSLERIPKPRQWPPILLRGFQVIKRHKSQFPAGVYIFAYHTIVDESKPSEWELMYKKGWVSKRHFEDHIEFLIRHMNPIPLSEAPAIIQNGKLDRPFFVITFDDGYIDIMDNAVPIIERHDIRPTVFANGSFTEGRVYYRILAAMLIERGYTKMLAQELRERIPFYSWSDSPNKLFDQTKNWYQPHLIEEATEAAYQTCIGETETLRVHLRLRDIKKLEHLGWQIGNHTFDHLILNTLDFSQIDKSVSSNYEYLSRNGISPINWLAYPNGKSSDVNENVKKWLEVNNNIHGMFCNGGVNLVPTRMQWLRLFAGNGGVELIRNNIEVELSRTRTALKFVRSID